MSQSSSDQRTVDEKSNGYVSNFQISGKTYTFIDMIKL